jgi:signal transduction histidine kinase
VIFRNDAKGTGHDPIPTNNDARLIAHVERQLASNVGAASARSLVSRILEGETISLESVITLIDEKEEVVRYSRELERQRVELEDTAAKLKLANEQLTRMDRMKDDFLSQVSHELRTPMTSIRSFADILSHGGPIDRAQRNRYMRIIQAESVRLTRLLDDILELGRFEAGAATLTIQSLDAVASARHAIDTMHGLAKVEGVAVFDGLGTGTAMVDVDEDRMTQVFVNLLSNAIKFNTSENPKVWLEMGPTNDTDHIEIHVRDNGPGIPPDQRNAVFSKFSRGWSESTQQKSGSGLGLPICRQIMESMGGDLIFMPNSVSGCTFVIRLVRSTPPASRTKTE